MRLSQIPGIDPQIRTRLHEAGVKSVEQLVEQTSTPEGRVALAKQVGIPLSQLDGLANQGDLMRLDDVNAGTLKLLARAGVDSVLQLRQVDAEPLHDKLAAQNMQWRLMPDVPSVARIQQWIDQAGELATQS